MEKNQLTQQQRKERTRTLLVLAAGKVFIEQGYHGASIDQIASFAGYTKGAVYFHFKNKQEILYAVIKYRSELILKRIENSDSSEDPLKSLLTETAQKELLGDWFDRDKWVVLFLEYLLFLQRNPDARRAFRKLQEVERKKLVALIKSRYAAAKVKPPLNPVEIAQIQEVVDIGFGVARLVDPKLPQSIYEKLISVAR